MLIEEALYRMLSQDAAIKNIAGESIFPVTIPQAEKGTTKYPAVVFGLTAREREQTHNGPSRIVRSDFNIECLGPEYLEVKKLADKVRLAITGKSSEFAQVFTKHAKGIFLDSEADDYVFDTVEELSLYRVPMSFRIQHWEDLA